jgi:DNA-binding MarR family transcriptional regulator
MTPAEAVVDIRRFNRFYTALIGVMDRHILRSPYSLTEVRVLYEIAHEDGANARKLKNILGTDEGYLSRTIDHLARAGLVVRRQSREDARVFRLSLSARGRRELERLESAAADQVARIISGLPRTELDEVVAGMQRIQALLGPGGPS